MVTHPFHPLFGERLEVLYVRREAAGRVYVRDGGDGRNVALDEAATDRGSEPAERPLTFDLLVELAALVWPRSASRRMGRASEPQTVVGYLDDQEEEMRLTH